MIGQIGQLIGRRSGCSHACPLGVVQVARSSVAAVWQHRAQFFGLAATVMRRLLVDHARQHGAAKRGAGACIVSLDPDETIDVSGSGPVDVMALNDALDALARIDPLRARMIELRFFAGLTTEETAD